MAESIYVWAWLSGETTPVRVGMIHEQGGETSFAYDDGYLDVPAAVPLYSELPLRRGRQRPLTGLTVPGCVNDSWPDGWAKVVIERRRLDAGRNAAQGAHRRQRSTLHREAVVTFGPTTRYQPRGRRNGPRRPGGDQRRPLTLAPAFDICPQPRSGGETQQAMAIGRDGYKAANLAGCVKRASDYGLDQREALDLVERQIEAVTSHWDDAADRARLNAAERRAAFGGPILNPSIFYGWGEQRPRSKQ